MKKIIVLVLLLCVAGFAHAEMLIENDFEDGLTEPWWSWGSGSGPGPWTSGYPWVESSGGVDDSQYMHCDPSTYWSSWGYLMFGNDKGVLAVTPGQVLIIDGYYKNFSGDLTLWGVLEWQDHTGDDVDYDGDGQREQDGDQNDNNDDRSGFTITLAGTGDWEHMTFTYTVPTNDLLGGLIDPPITHVITGWGNSLGQVFGYDNLSVSIGGVENVYPPDGEEYVPIDAVLEWTRPVGYDPNAYDVYFTTDPNANKPEHLVVDGALVTTYDPPGDLEFNTTYYWRVNAYDANCIEACKWPDEGPVWSFTTMPEEPVFTTDAEHTLAAEGGSAVFSVVSPNADSFQWYKEPATAINDGDDGGDVSVVSDATSSTLTIDNVNKAADEGFYYCTATNIYDSTDSTHAKLETPKLLAHWTLDSPLVSNQYADETGNHDADPNKPVGVNFTTGIIDEAVDMSDNFGWANAGNWRPNEYSSQLTVSSWFKIPDTNDITGDGQGIVSKRQDNSFEWALYVRGGDAWHPADNYVRFTSWEGGDAWASLDAIGEEWTYVTATVDGTGAGHLYVNGDEEAVVDEFEFGANVDADILIGKGTPDQDQFLFPGLIDDVKIYNYARDSYEIAADYTDVAGGSICAEDFPFDYNQDCKVDLADVAEFALIWRNCNIIPPEDCLLIP